MHNEMTSWRVSLRGSNATAAISLVRDQIAAVVLLPRNDKLDS